MEVVDLPLLQGALRAPDRLPVARDLGDEDGEVRVRAGEVREALVGGHGQPLAVHERPEELVEVLVLGAVVEELAAEPARKQRGRDDARLVDEDLEGVRLVGVGGIAVGPAVLGEPLASLLARHLEEAFGELVVQEAVEEVMGVALVQVADVVLELQRISFLVAGAGGNAARAGRGRSDELLA